MTDNRPGATAYAADPDGSPTEVRIVARHLDTETRGGIERRTPTGFDVRDAAGREWRTAAVYATAAAVPAADVAPVVTVTRSAGADGAWLVMVDTAGEPDGSDGSPGLRVMVNDGDVFTGVAYAPAAADDAAHDRARFATEDAIETAEQLLSYYEHHADAMFGESGAHAEWWTQSAVTLLRGMLPEGSAYREE